MNKREAARKGAETCRARGELKREIKAAGSQKVCELLYEPDLPEFVQKMPLHNPQPSYSRSYVL